jgi:hypothetical protein
MPDFSCADYTFPLLSRKQSLELLRLLDFEFVDIGLFERNPNYLPSLLMSSPADFIRGVQQDLTCAQIRTSDLFLQIGLEPAQSFANDPDPVVRVHNREVFKRVALRAAWLLHKPACMTLAYPMLGTRTDHHTTASFRA